METYWRGRGLALLWFATLAGPLAHALHLQIAYALIKPACARGTTVMLVLVALGSLALALAGAAVAWSCLKRTGDASDLGGTPIDRSYFMAAGALALDLLLALLIVTQAQGQIWLSPCE